MAKSNLLNCYLIISALLGFSNCAKNTNVSQTHSANTGTYSIKVLPAVENNKSNVPTEDQNEPQGQAQQGSWEEEAEEEEEGDVTRLTNWASTLNQPTEQTACSQMTQATERMRCFEERNESANAQENSSNTPWNQENANQSTKGTFLKQENKQSSKIHPTKLCFIYAGVYQLTQQPKTEVLGNSSSYFVRFKNAPNGCPDSGYLATSHIDLLQSHNSGSTYASLWRRPVGTNYPITSDHCKLRKCSNCSNPHQGIDYGTPRGTTINAAANGQVAFRGTVGGLGKMVAIHHDNNGGTTSRSAHNDRLLPAIQLGTRVSAGQAISISGCTGTCFGPHLHFDLATGKRTIFGYRANFNPHTLSAMATDGQGRPRCGAYTTPPKSSLFR